MFIIDNFLKIYVVIGDFLSASVSKNEPETKSEQLIEIPKLNH